MDEKYLLFIGLAMLNPTIENLGLGFQKWAIDRSPHATTRVGKWGWTGVWIFGLLLTISVAFIAFKILSLGNASTAGAFAGFGLVTLTIFSFLVLKEKILPRELLGIFAIIVGTSILGYFSHGSQKEGADYSLTGLLIFFAAYITVVIIAFVASRKKPNLSGVLIGMIAGSMAGAGNVIQKIVSPMFMKAFANINAEALATVASTAFTWIMIALAIGGITVLQFAYKKGKAVQIVPARAVAFILTPLIAGPAFLGERIPPLGFVGIVIVIAGVIITTTANPSKLAH